MNPIRWDYGRFKTTEDVKPLVANAPFPVSVTAGPVSSLRKSYIFHKPDWVETAHLNLICVYYLIANYCYYCLRAPLITDYDFDHLCARLDEEWDECKHPFKRIIDRDRLAHCTGAYILPGDYPAMIRMQATGIARDEGIWPHGPSL